MKTSPLFEHLPFLIPSLISFLVVTASGSFAENPLPATKAPLANTPISFEQNVGQTSRQVRFLSRAGRYRVYLTQDSAVLDIAGKKGQGSVIRTTVLATNPVADIRGYDRQNWVTNYLVGSQSDWKLSVPNYAKIKYSSVYPGIDLVYYGNKRQLEYDFTIAPEVDPSQIKLRVEGANKIFVSHEGALVLETAAGTVSWKRPVAYQGLGDDRRLVLAYYHISGNTVTFELGSYDRGRALVIDPVLVYGTYLDGSNGYDLSTSLLVDPAGFAYILGSTSSTDFPTTPGAYQRQIVSSLGSQTFVTKLSQDGSSLVWSTIIGGSGQYNFALPNGFALDGSGNTYIVGATADVSYSTITNTFTYYPSTYPTTPGAYNTKHVPTQIYFLTKLNSSGSALVYSTFLASQPNLQGIAVALDAADDAYVTGIYKVQNSQSAPFPCTPGAYQCKYAGKDDAFVMKFNAQGTALDYATLVGGSQTDDAYSVIVNSRGEATISGPTYSTDYPITPNGMRQTDEGGFVTTLNSAGTGLIYSTVLNHVLQLSVMRDSNGDYYIGGSAGTALPVTANAYQKAFPGIGSGNHLGFLTVIDTSGNLVYSSYFGGNLGAGAPQFFGGGYEYTSVQLVSPTAVTVTGYRANDPSFPVTDRTYEQDTCDFLARFNPRASSGKTSLLYSGCTPINMTDNLYIEQFRGIPLFASGLLQLDSFGHLYALNASRTGFRQRLPKESAQSIFGRWQSPLGWQIQSCGAGARGR